LKTAVVILNWNGKNFLEKFLPGLVASLKGYDAEVVVADNASTDGSQQLLKEQFPDVMVLQFDENLGFTGGYNKAFDMLAADEEIAPQYFLLLNSDIEVTENWLYPLEEWMDLHEECAACAPKLHSYQQREKFEYAGAAGGYLDMFGYPFCRGRVMKRVEEDKGQYDDPADVLWASGACLMVRSSVWEDIGGLDERFFAHMEEIDFCWRARLSGYSVSVVPRSLVYHVGGGTLPQESPWKLQLNYRNNLLMLSNNLADSLVLRNFFDVLSVTAPELAVSTDDFQNCMEVYEEMSDKLQNTLIDACVSDAVKTARRRIFLRRVFDGASAMVYLFTGKKEYFKAVLAAHKEFRKLREPLDAQDVRDLLLTEIDEDFPVSRKLLKIDLNKARSSRVGFVGIIDMMMIPISLVSGDKVFEVMENLQK